MQNIYELTDMKTYNRKKNNLKII